MKKIFNSANSIYFTKDHDMVRRAVSDFIKKEINPHVDQWEEEGIAPLKEIFKKMGDLGFLGIRYDPQYGGQGLDYWYDTVFLEELGHIQALGLSVAITVQTHMATPAIAEFGNEHYERFSLLPFACIAARDIIDMTVEHIRQRVVFGKPLIKKQVLRHRLADWLTEIECLQQLIYHIVRMKEAGLDATREVSMGKLIASKVLIKVADGCLQMYGGLGFMNEMLISRYYRDARGLAIGGGADEVMSDVIAKLEGY